jgi:hypothetical protein
MEWNFRSKSGVESLEAFEGYDQSLVIVEEWDEYEELKGFEEKRFRLGGGDSCYCYESYSKLDVQ